MRIELKGVTRIVLIFNKLVIKIPKPFIWNHFLKGLIANIHENRTWKYNSGKYEVGRSHLLCPVIWASWGGWMLIMKRAREYSREDFESSSSDDFIEHKKYFEGDDTISNYGWIDNQLVKIDYGQ